MLLLLSSTAIGLSVWIILALRGWRNNPQGLPFPPGPPGLPFVGNFFNAPRGTPWLAFSSMARKYGDLMHIRNLNRHIIVVSSLEVASDLFDKRFANYSNRFRSAMLSDLMDMGWSMGRLNYGEEWRKRRKIFHHYYSAAAVRKHEGLLFRNIDIFLQRLLDDPINFFGHSRFVFAALLLNVTYGVEIENETNEHLVEAEAWQHGFNQAIQPGRFWVDYLPVLQYIPEWFPGANFKKLARRWRQNMYNARDRPFDLAKGAMETGTAVPSVVTDALENISDSPDKEEQEFLTRYSLGAAFGAGVDTSAPTLQIFFYAMLTNPDVQKKAQAELDNVVGPDRLPNMDDRPNLPYVEAVLKELLRWQPVTPLALPHDSASGDEYRGYYIPKGSIVLGNAWHILHDPVEYPCPDQFRPHRFLNADGTINEDVPDPSVACFGFGRRICPGRFLSLDALFGTISCLLHTFNISPASDDQGKPIIPELRMKPGMICHPEPFQCSIQVRSLTAQSIIRGPSQQADCHGPP